MSRIAAALRFVCAKRPVIVVRPRPLLVHLARPLSTSCRLDVLYFTKKHEWVSVDDGEVGTVGISNYAQEALGDVVYAQLPEPDDSVTRGEECGALESVKAASELYSPVTGTVLEKNEAVENAPALINTSAMDEGWLFKVKLTQTSELEQLLDEDAYKAYLKEHEDKDA